MELKEAQEKLTPKKYREALNFIELRDIYLKQTNCLLHSRTVAESANIEIKDKISDVKIVENVAIIEHQYSIKVASGGTDNFELSATFVLKYELKKTLPEEFYEIYKSVSLPVHSYPFFRELVSSMVTRAGLPKLIMPLRKDVYSN